MADLATVERLEHGSVGSFLVGVTGISMTLMVAPAWALSHMAWGSN